MKTAPLFSLLALSSLACVGAPVGATDEQLSIAVVHLSKSGAPQIEFDVETVAERAARVSVFERSSTKVHADTGAIGGNWTGCGSYAGSVMIELCDNTSPGCATGNIACIYGSPEDAMLPLTSVPRAVPLIWRPGLPPAGNFYQHVVQYRPNQLGAVFEDRRTSFPWFTYCSETSIDDPWWIRAGSCTANLANLVGVNCIGSGAPFTCSRDSDCCGIGAWCNAGTCTGGT